MRTVDDDDDDVDDTLMIMVMQAMTIMVMLMVAFDRATHSAGLSPGGRPAAPLLLCTILALNRSYTLMLHVTIASYHHLLNAPLPFPRNGTSLQRT